MSELPVDCAHPAKDVVFLDDGMNFPLEVCSSCLAMRRIPNSVPRSEIHQWDRRFCATKSGRSALLDCALSRYRFLAEFSQGSRPITGNDTASIQMTKLYGLIARIHELADADFEEALVPIAPSLIGEDSVQ